VVPDGTVGMLLALNWLPVVGPDVAVDANGVGDRPPADAGFVEGKNVVPVGTGCGLTVSCDGRESWWWKG
jgi:hypothetical protein